jgi:hypothetical protein
MPPVYFRGCGLLLRVWGGPLREGFIELLPLPRRNVTLTQILLVMHSDEEVC